jgi:ankyrin repeat protein
LLGCRHTQIDSQDNNGWTALHVAASEGKLSSVEILLNHRADVNAKTVNGATPLHYFVRCDYGADRKKYFSLLRKFFAAGADPNCQNSSGETALHAIALKNKVEEFKLLLTETKADVNLQNKYPLPPAPFPRCSD